MDLLQIVLIASIQVAAILSKRHAKSSEESIENLLYYKDCQQKRKPAVTPKSEPLPLRHPVPPPPPPPRFECPYPKMCCSLSCNNECGNGSPSPSIMARQHDMNSIMNFGQPSFPPNEHQSLFNQRAHMKKVKPAVLPTIGARREFGFTKERIKTLIAKDDDIRKILKDLVRVTMQKVDLVSMINSRKKHDSVDIKKPETSSSHDDMEYLD